MSKAASLRMLQIEQLKQHCLMPWLRHPNWRWPTLSLIVGHAYYPELCGGTYV